MTRMGRGVTGLAAKGMYSDETKNMPFLCSFQKRDRGDQRNCIRIRSESNFLSSVTPVKIFGEGFIEDKNQLT